MAVNHQELRATMASEVLHTDPCKDFDIESVRASMNSKSSSAFSALTLSKSSISSPISSSKPEGSLGFSK